MKFLFLSTLLFLMTSCGTPHSGTIGLSTQKLLVRTERFPPNLTIIISNSSKNEIRIWEQWNSWGWGNVVVELQNINGGRKYFLKQREDRDWTVNYPSFMVIGPNEEKAIEIKLDDGWWMIPNDLKVNDQSFRIRVRLSVKSSAEAKTFGILTGEIQSDWKEVQ